MSVARIEVVVTLGPLPDLVCLDASSSHAFPGFRVILMMSMADSPALDPTWSVVMAALNLLAYATLWLPTF